MLEMRRPLRGFDNCPEESIEYAPEPPLTSDSLVSPDNNPRKQFSFNLRPVSSSRKRLDRSLQMKSIRDDLSKLEHEHLVELLIDEIQQYQSMKCELFRQRNRNNALAQEQVKLKQLLKERREEQDRLMRQQAVNSQKVRRLQREVQVFKTSHGRGYSHVKLLMEEGEWEKKYSELAKHLDYYIVNTKEIQEEYARRCELLSTENSHAYEHIKQCEYRLKEQYLHNLGLANQLSQARLTLSDYKRLNQTSSKRAEDTKRTNNELSRSNLKAQIMGSENSVKSTSMSNIPDLSDQAILQRRYEEKASECISLQMVIQGMHIKTEGLVRENAQLRKQVEDYKTAVEGFSVKLKEEQEMRAKLVLHTRKQSNVEDKENMNSKSLGGSMIGMVGIEPLKELNNSNKMLIVKLKNENLDLKRELTLYEEVCKKQSQKSEMIKEELERYWKTKKPEAGEENRGNAQELLSEMKEISRTIETERGFATSG